MNMDSTLLQNIRVWTPIGVPDPEREAAQEVLVTIELLHPLQAVALSDNVADGIDYAEVIRNIESLAHIKRKTMERFAKDIADSMLKKFRPAGGVTVTVTKKPMLPLASVSVTITRP